MLKLTRIEVEQMGKSFLRQHEVLRVPNRWSGEDKALVIQLNRILDDIYKKYGRLTWEDLDEALREMLVTDVAYDSENKKITKTVNGTATDVVTVATIKSALGSFTWGAIAGR